MSVRSAYEFWPVLNQRLRDRVATLTEAELALQPSPDRWPLWASIGHLACQRVFAFCDFAGEPGAETTRFTNASFDCPGDDDLEHVLSAAELVEAIESTFRIIDGVLDRWTPESLDEVISRPEWDDDRRQTRGHLLSRSYAHDVWHVGELNETLGRNRLVLIDPWS